MIYLQLIAVNDVLNLKIFNKTRIAPVGPVAGATLPSPGARIKVRW